MHRCVDKTPSFNNNNNNNIYIYIYRQNTQF